MLFLTISLSAQDFNTNWERTASNNPFTWLGTSSTERGMAYNPVTNNVYVVSRSGSGLVQVIDAANGDDTGTLDETGISGGTFPLNSIDVSYDGSIYGVNLAIGTGAFKVYKWADESSAPVVVLEDDLGGISKRIGDKFTVVGSDADNTTEIWVVDATGKGVYQYTTTDNGASFTLANSVVLADHVGSSPDVHPGFAAEDGPDFVINSNGHNPKGFKWDGELVGTIDGSLVATGSNAIFAVDLNGHEFLGTFAYGTGNENCRIVDVTTMEMFTVTNSLYTNSNPNGTGDVDFFVNGDGNLDIYVLSTNNGVGNYTVMMPQFPEPIAAVEVDDNMDFVPDRIGETVMVEGIVNSVNLTASSNRFGYSLQDETGGIHLTKGSQPGGEPIYNIGDVIRVEGTLGQYRGQNQMDLSEDQLNAIQLVNTGVEVPIMDMSIADFMADPEQYEGMLVRIMGIYPTEGSDDWPAEGSDANMTFTDGIDEMTVRIDRDTEIDGMPEPFWPANVIGVGTQFTFASPPNDGYQLSPNFYSDFQGVPAQVTTKFQVDMTYEISGGAFDPVTDVVFVRGSFNDWSEADQLMPNATDPNIYEGEVVRDFAVGNTIIFKYAYNTANETVWENDPNREYTYTADDIATGYTELLYTFNDYVPGGDIEVTFVADMFYEIESGRFDPLTDMVYARGDFNGWSTDDQLMPTGDPYLFEKTTTLNLSAGTNINYKWYYEGPNTSAWEGGGDRVYTVTEDDVNAGSFTIQRTFNDLNPDIILQNDAVVKFRIDVTDAADMNGNPFSVVETVGLVGSVSPLQWPVGGWPDEDSTKVIWLNDDGVMGDEVAGDNIWSKDILFEQYSPLDVFYKHSINWGLPTNNGANDNESISGEDHQIQMPVNLLSAAIEVVPFGQMGPHALENVQLYGEVGWMVNVDVMDAGGTENSDMVVFGTHPEATDGLDIVLGEEELPPLPPAGAFDTRFVLPVTPPVASLKDIRPEGDMIEWELYFQPGTGGYPITLNWDSANLPEGQFHIMDPFGGSLVNVDMKAQNSLEVTNTSITTLVIQFSTSITSEVVVAEGWNLLSVPVLAADMSKDALFPTSTSNAFMFDGGYQIAETLENGAGYWLKFAAAENVSVSGMQNNMPVDVVQGWNLIGPFDMSVMVADITTMPAGIISSNFFGFENGYTAADELMPGMGYWIKVSDAGELMLLPPVAKKGDETKDEVAEDALYTISIATSDGAAGSYGTMVGIDPAATDGLDGDLGEIELPPLPPAGVYDARLILPDGTTGSPADYREGDNNFTGEVTYTLKYQLGDGGTAMTLDIDIPEVPGTVTMTVQDPFGGVLVNEVLNEGVGQVVVTNTSLTELKLIVDYNAPIPVELSSFAANVVGETIQIAWETATETNNKGFEIERSEDGESFTNIGYIDGNGTTTEKQGYSFTDHHPTSGTYYYRLRQIDFDGTANMSQTIEVDFVPTEYSLGQNYPNPFNPATKIKFAVPVESKVTVTLYNMLGQKVKDLVSAQFNVGLHEIDLNASDLASGMYIYSITAQGVDGNNFVDTKKMMLMK